MLCVTDEHRDEGQTMVNSKAPCELTTEDLQDGCCGGHLGSPNKMVLAIQNLHVPPMPPTKFWLNLTNHSGADEWNRTILAILNLYVALMLPIKFGLNPHYSSGGVVV